MSSKIYEKCSSLNIYLFVVMYNGVSTADYKWLDGNELCNGKNVDGSGPGLL